MKKYRTCLGRGYFITLSAIDQVCFATENVDSFAAETFDNFSRHHFLNEKVEPARTTAKGFAQHMACGRGYAVTKQTAEWWHTMGFYIPWVTLLNGSASP